MCKEEKEILFHQVQKRNLNIFTSKLHCARWGSGDLTGGSMQWHKMCRRSFQASVDHISDASESIHLKKNVMRKDIIPSLELIYSSWAFCIMLDRYLCLQAT